MGYLKFAAASVAIIFSMVAYIVLSVEQSMHILQDMPLCFPPYELRYSTHRENPDEWPLTGILGNLLAGCGVESHDALPSVLAEDRHGVIP